MSKPLLILDIDETLIHATESPLEIPHDFRVGPYYVHRRPGLDSFLLSCAEHYKIAIWSSAGSTYVGWIIGAIKPPSIELEFAWSSEQCTQRFDCESYDRYEIKDLKKVKRRGYDLDRVLMVDDTPKKLEKHYGNLIKVPEFVGDPSDDVLPKLALYLESLTRFESFRKIEKRGWLNNVQIH